MLLEALTVSFFMKYRKFLYVLRCNTLIINVNWRTKEKYDDIKNIIIGDDAFDF